MLAKLLQPENALLPILVTLSGIVMLVKPVQFWNELLRILLPLVRITVFNEDGTLLDPPNIEVNVWLTDGIVMLVKLVQPKNAIPPIYVTLSGIVMLVKPAQASNALSPICVTLSGIVMLVKPVQFWNALLPILVTLSGIVMLVKPVLPENAKEGILSPLVRISVFNEDGTDAPNIEIKN